LDGKNFYFKRRRLKLMKKIICFSVIFTGLMLFLSGTCLAAQFCNSQGCVDFPGGVSSFADSVVDYQVGSGGVTNPYKITSNALGAPNYDGGVQYVSLGSGGSIVLKFTDNSLTGSGNSNLDLWIFEVGPDVEDTFVEISKNGTAWSNVGAVTGSTSGIDIDAFGFGTTDFFSYVRLTDDPNKDSTSGVTAGADIDAVGAITTAPPVATPEPVTLLFLGLGLVGAAGVRRFIK
jgi:hypothetical protein